MENTIFRALKAKKPLNLDGTPNWIYFNIITFTKKGSIRAFKDIDTFKIVKESLESIQDKFTTNPYFTKVKTIIVVKKSEPTKAYNAYIPNPITLGPNSKPFHYVISGAFPAFDNFIMGFDELLIHPDYIVIK